MADVGKWVVNYDNGPKVDIPNFCGKCGAFMKEMSEKLDRRRGEAE